MKNICIILGSILLNTSLSFAQPEPLTVNRSINRKIQVAILFDASGSMDGLLSQAKSRIWNIVNELSSLRYEGQTPLIEIALYEYGLDNIPASENHLRQLVSLSTDLDMISQKLFGIKTNGGSEYCGAVIGKSLNELNWSPNPTDLKMIYIAGNEIFNQGSVDYKEVCKTASTRQIYINTIYCGNYEQGIREFWQDGAKLGKGDYFNIDANKQIDQIQTPYDVKINSYNDSLNQTYYGYGSNGFNKKNIQAKEDMNAEAQSISSKAERSIVKSKAAYSNSEWDLIDADKEGKDITLIQDEQLPEEFKGKTDDEKKALIEKKKSEREAFQSEIGILAKERQIFIDEEIKKRASAGEQDDFGTSVKQSIIKKATEIGFKKEE